MSPRDKRLEQAKPKGNSPAKISARKFPPKTHPKPGKTDNFGAEKLPSGKIAQHRAKPGMTSPQ